MKVHWTGNIKVHPVAVSNCAVIVYPEIDDKNR